MMTACLSCALTATNAVTTESDSVIKREADAFIKRMGNTLQPGQRDAIIEAIHGNYSALTKVRNARNDKPVYPSNVRVSEPTERLRLYTNIDGNQKDKPLLVYFHGGGWTIGGLNSCARFCSELCSKGGISVLAVDYRLAPEHPYPAPLDDCEEALEVAFRHAESWGCSPRKIFAGGDSSGGNLAVSSTMRIEEGKVAGLLLFYPVVRAWNDGTKSWKKGEKGLGLDGDLMEAFNRSYASEEEARTPEVSPILASDESLSRLPRTLLIAAERDILSDQGEEFIERIASLGVAARRIEYPGAVHLFITVPGQPTAFAEAVAQSVRFIGK